MRFSTRRSAGSKAVRECSGAVPVDDVADPAVGAGEVRLQQVKPRQRLDARRAAGAGPGGFAADARLLRRAEQRTWRRHGCSGLAESLQRLRRRAANARERFATRSTGSASQERLALNVQWPYTENSTQPESVMDRRTSLLTTFALAVGAAGATKTASAQSTSGMKVTALYGHPKNAEDFEKYYFGTHMPLVAAAKGGNRTETSRCPPAADGSPAAFYRIFEIWFDSPAEMTAITTSQEWKKVRADVENFATGGVTRIVSKLD